MSYRITTRIYTISKQNSAEETQSHSDKDHVNQELRLSSRIKLKDLKRKLNCIFVCTLRAIALSFLRFRDSCFGGVNYPETSAMIMNTGTGWGYFGEKSSSRATFCKTQSDKMFVSKTMESCCLTTRLCIRASNGLYTYYPYFKNRVKSTG